ncbi:hypothetical protein SBOR_3187 [Sclerotinia borealis F-4128]|uniref:PHD-type domain-containing protein n=1 Tax=Sclerotinia borealis (strain F-4128) TaxID=1432307 RepID=W9CPN5_SCLBF|nr:hypothetical protein SBOR_3187 [Sclerotinia borealis F-4128]
MDAPNRPPASADGSSDTTMGESFPPKYVPQFSAATEMILQRMKAGITGGLSSIGITETPPGYEEMRRNVMSGMKTTQNMQINTPPPKYQTSKKITPKVSAAPKSETPTGSVNSAGTKKKGKGPRAGQKRKRVKDDSESADDSDALSGLGGDSDSDDSNSATMEMPKITQSGRQIVKPTQFVPPLPETSSRKRSSASTNKRSQNQEQALCKRCGRGNSPHNNMIVFCDGCNLGWHQMCHDPVVSEEEVKDEEAPWFCNDCARKRGIKPAPSKTDGVSWAGKSLDQRRAYLALLPHPQLVALLIKASTLHPDMPIFPANSPPFQPRQSQNISRPTTNHITQPFPPSATSTAGLFPRSESNPSATINFVRKIASNSTASNVTPTPMFTSSFPSAPAFTHASSAPPMLPPQASTNTESNADPNGIDNQQELAQESRESTPNSPPYPKAGTGLMSKLGPDDEDIEWLVDSEDFEAFSHTVYDDHEEKDVEGM